MPSPTRPAPPLADAPSGFPSPAEDYIDQRLDLHQHLIKNPAATYFIRVRGDSMRGAGIAGGDLLVVDRSVRPRPGHVVVATVDGELTVTHLGLLDGKLVLAPENPESAPIALTGSVEIWGVAIHVIHRLTPCSSP